MKKFVIALATVCILAISGTASAPSFAADGDGSSFMQWWSGLFPSHENQKLSTKEQYELQERCGKRAEEVFAKVYNGGGVSNTEKGQDNTSYENHYSFTLNRCFFLEIVTGFNTKEEPHTISTMKTLFDLNDHKEYGTFFTLGVQSKPMVCEVQDKVCGSEKEWKEFLKPYMEE